ncbi:ubiquitin-conjugating enzyme E2-binding protein [Annulohypoxylon maeteangense]|uniref:ubiquitin-conjugating enzyme E2-binding protein n=1 Tax=Annulohypoxylon maeteangense TaxID=1927788 RepID=UPI002007699D|nr:ubiquitin-conjugating enzyme E2-binding protein [Annulohypoxylon maeteangense]KAI0888629.1 ubiquitin-conjugating enzyme E2-binding protein [Annulohypoxylon maeteangense]
MSASQPILIYAELLANIRQVSVVCLLPTPSRESTSAIISSDSLVFTIHHDDIETSVRLPGKLNVYSPPREQILPQQKLGSRYLPWRLPLATTPGHYAVSALEDQTVPWSANDLQPESSVTCRTCRAPIVESGTIKVWKDLPSENWAEMMEFWHCHKPHDHGHGHEHDNDGLTSKGYGASSRISAQPGVGFVDLTSFLLSETDLSASNIIKGPSPLELHKGPENQVELAKNGQSHHSQVESLPVFCKYCKSQLGVLNNQDSSVSLFKWQIHANEQIQRDINNSPSLSHCISAMLLATMARSGCSKSIILPMKSQEQLTRDKPQSDEKHQSLLNVWVFNSNITFSSTEEIRSPIKAVKVFYRMVSQDEADKLLDSMISDVQDITLPTDAIEKVIDILSNSNGLLPPNDRQLKEWKVGLLEKWDGKGPLISS